MDFGLNLTNRRYRMAPEGLYLTGLHNYHTGSMSSGFCLPNVTDGRNKKPCKALWDLPISQQVKFEFGVPKIDAIGKITSVVGGFVGSKVSQRNEHKRGLFPIGTLISNCLHDHMETKRTSSQEGFVMSSLFLPEACRNGIIKETFLANSPLSKNFTGDKKEEDMRPTLEVTEEEISEEKCNWRDSPQDEKPIETVNFAEEILEDSKKSSETRHFSECSVDSSDSDFIVFGEAEQCEEWSDDSDEEEDDEDEEKRLHNACERWKKFYGESPPIISSEENRQVRFLPCAHVHVMHVWDYASRAARIGPWEEAARDRVRFAQRIARTEEILAPVLSPEHREKMRQYINQR